MDGKEEERPPPTFDSDAICDYRDIGPEKRIFSRSSFGGLADQVAPHFYERHPEAARPDIGGLWDVQKRCLVFYDVNNNRWVTEEEIQREERIER
ncbi:unnamed protein product, partial [Phaeothamnion confervicola]